MRLIPQAHCSAPAAPSPCGARPLRGASTAYRDGLFGLRSGPTSSPHRRIALRRTVELDVVIDAGDSIAGVVIVEGDKIGVSGRRRASSPRRIVHDASVDVVVFVAGDEIGAGARRGA